MGKIKKFLPFIAFGLIFVAGVVLLVFPTLTNLEFFYRAGIAIVGFIGFCLMFFISVANKKQAKRQEALQREAQLKNYNAQKQIYNSIYSAISDAQEDAMPKKITCKFCNYVYSELDGKCPNCGAPPDKAN